MPGENNLSVESSKCFSDLLHVGGPSKRFVLGCENPLPWPEAARTRDHATMDKPFWGTLYLILFQIIFFHALARFYIATKSISSIQHRKLWVEPAIVAKGGSEVADGDVGKVGGGEVVVAAAVVGGPAAPVKPALAAVEGVLVVVIVPVVLYWWWYKKINVFLYSVTMGVWH